MGTEPEDTLPEYEDRPHHNDESQFNQCAEWDDDLGGHLYAWFKPKSSDKNLIAMYLVPCKGASW